MSIFRKTVLTSAIIGAGLVTSAGAAFAGDDPGSGDHDGHSGHSGHSSSHHHGTEIDKSCVSGSGSGSKHANGEVAVASILDAPISSNVCNILNHNLSGNGSGNTFNVGSAPDAGFTALPDSVAAPDTSTASPSEVKSTANQAPSTGQAQSAVPSGTTTTPIQGK